MSRPPVPAPLKRFIWDIQSMIELDASEREIFLVGGDLLARLVSADDWLPALYAEATPGRGAPFQLYADAQERFSIVCTALAGGQALPVYQDAVWELIGVLRGGMTRRRFAAPGGRPLQLKGEARTLRPGMVDTYSPRSGEAVQLGNAFADRLSISIHVHGGEIGGLARRVLAADGGACEVVSGYANGEDAPPYDIYAIQTEIKD